MRSLDAAPSIGSFWTKSVNGGTFCQAASSSRPSTRIGAIGHAYGVGALASVLARLREAGRRVQEESEKNGNQETQGEGTRDYRGENQKLVLMAKK